MRNLVSLKNDFQMTSTLKNMASTYEEIAVMRLRKLRDNVLYNRDFLKRVGEVYMDVKVSYKREVEKINSKSNFSFQNLFIGKSKTSDIKKSFTTFNKNGKKVSVLITSNKRLIGPISQRVFSEFIANIANEKTDILIIGKKGYDFYKDKKGVKGINYFNFPENENLNELKPIVMFLTKYEKVDVFYGKFLNLVNQVGEKMILSGDSIMDLPVPVKSANYLFEPSLFEVLNFFEVQIFSALFKQTVLESNLAVYGSQIQAMEQTTYNSEKELENISKKIMRTRKYSSNKKQIQRLSGMSLWG